MNPEAINSVINNICAKLELPTTKGLEYISALGIKAIVWPVAFFLFMLIPAGLFITVLREYKKTHGEDCIMPIFFFGAITFGLFVLTLHSSCDVILWLRHPEAWAVQYLLNRF